MAQKYATNLRNAKMDAIATFVGNGGKLRIYSGTQPANPQAAITGTLLAELTCGSPFAAGAASGVLTAGSITQDSSADATGTASHYRCWKSDGTTACIDGSAGTSGTDLILNTASIVAGGAVSVTSWTMTDGNP